MITEAQWAALKDTIDRVCDRQSDEETVVPGVVVRRRDGLNPAITVRLYKFSGWDLEPEGE